MDNLGNHSSRNDNSDKPIPFDNGPSATVPTKENPAGGTAPVSHAPLNLGGSGTGAPVASSAAVTATTHAGAPKPATKVAVAPQAPAGRPAAAGPAPTGRISNCKTFFTKLHPGAIKFMDDQITAWLKENPGIVIKRTNAVTGEIVDKKTEPSILITIWY